MEEERQAALTSAREKAQEDLQRAEAAVKAARQQAVSPATAAPPALLPSGTAAKSRATATASRGPLTESTRPTGLVGTATTATPAAAPSRAAAGALCLRPSGADGRLTLVHAAITRHAGGNVTFYVNTLHPELSSLDDKQAWYSMV